MEGLFENTDKLKGKQKEKVIEFEEQGRLSKVLATIDINVPVQFDAKTYEVEAINKDELSEIFKDLEFRRLAAQILGETQSNSAELAPQMVLVFNKVFSGVLLHRPQ